MELGVLVGRFDDLVHDAKAIPLTNEVRLLRDDAEGLVAEMQSSSSERTARPVEQLAELVARAKAVPLTDFIRINRRKAYERLDAIRQALDADEAPR